jgi:amino acid transporter
MEASTAPAPEDDGGSGKVFSRTSSGLIRTAGAWDVFIYNVGLVSVGIAIAFNQYYGPSLYPGAAVWVSTMLAVLGMLAAATTFYFWSVIFPRSGGVYVSLSRTTTPGLAFTFSLVETIILLYYAALAASLIVVVGLSPFFATVGSIAGNDTMITWAGDVAKPKGVFWVGTGLLILAGLLLASGTRRYFTVQRILFAIAIIGTFIFMIVLLFGSRGTFQNHLASVAHLNYDKVISAAKKNGYAPHGFDFGTTLKFMIWPLLPLLGAIQSIGIGGEVKRVQRSQLFGMLGAVLGTGLLIAAVALLSSHVFGYTFQGAISFNSLSGLPQSTEGTIGASPYFTVLAGILANNVVLAGIIMATFVAWIWFWIPAELAYTTRSMIAWSFDRLAPEGLGYVSRRFNTPVVAIVLSTAGSIVFMWFIAFKTVAFLTMIEALLVVWGTAMASAIVFPWVRREFFERSPARNARLAGIPVMSIAGALSVAFFGLSLVLLWRDPNAAGPLLDVHKSLGDQPTEFWIIGGTIVFGIVWYIGNKIYRRRKGVDVDLAFQQIPIE